MPNKTMPHTTFGVSSKALSLATTLADYRRDFIAPAKRTEDVFGQLARDGISYAERAT
jgi:hypothetical protein